MGELKHQAVMRAALAAFALSGLLAAPAHAKFAVCNKGAHAASVAIGHFDGTDWMSEGWWIIGPNACENLIAVPLDARYYYLYANDGGSGTWDGSTEFCTDVRKFSIVGRGHCAARGYNRKGFFQIDTHQMPDWTQTLSD
jgi:uncharacterized membrane protein